MAYCTSLPSSSIAPKKATRLQRSSVQRAVATLVLLVLVVFISNHVKLKIVTDGCVSEEVPQLSRRLHMHGPEPDRAAASLLPEYHSHHIFASSLTDTCPQRIIPGSWMQEDAVHSIDGMLPFTEEVQQAIWKHQHPADCSKARFLLFKAPASGIGSVFHMQTVALAAALDTGRILHELPGNFLTNGTYCGSHTTADSCYFEPLTNCSLTMAELHKAPVVREASSLLKASEHRVLLADTYRLAKYFRPKVPAMFKSALSQTAIPSKNRHYWWRAQGVAYIVRPNARTLAELQQRKSLKFRGIDLAPGCISLYIRHGDKSSESPVFSDTHYEGVVKRLLDTNPALTNQLFLSTEDPVTVQFFTSNGNSSSSSSGSSRGSSSSNSGSISGSSGSSSSSSRDSSSDRSTLAEYAWRTSYVDMPRKPDSHTSNLKYMKAHGITEEMLDGLLNLDLALQCDGFVGSMYSNWARLIDELRSTVRCKANAMYFDAIYSSPAEMDFNW